MTNKKIVYEVNEWCNMYNYAYFIQFDGYFKRSIYISVHLFPSNFIVFKDHFFKRITSLDLFTGLTLLRSNLLELQEKGHR